MRRLVRLALSTCATLWATVAGVTPQAPRPTDGWQTGDGTTVEVVTDGLRDPVAVALVPPPIVGPYAALYFVAERSGRILVGTADGRVHPFAQSPFDGEPESASTEIDALALAPEQGFVFVSYRTCRPGGVLESNLVRFECGPGELTTRPSAMRSLRDIIAGDLGVVGHELRPLAVRGTELFVGVDNHANPLRSRDPDSPGGKILRMDLDGGALADSPFFTPDATTTTRDFVWSLGLRKPRALAFVGDGILVADGGLGFDRIVRAGRGSDHGFDGTKWSLGLDPTAVFGPGAEIVALAVGRLPGATGTRDALIVALTDTAQTPPEAGLESSERVVLSAALDQADGRLVAPPELLLGHAGRTEQEPRDIAADDTSIWVLIGEPDGPAGAVVRIRPEARAEDPAGRPDNPLSLIASRGCLVCHDHESSDPPRLGRSLEPNALAARLMKRLHSDEFLAQLDRADEFAGQPFQAFAFARNDVREARGMARVRTWMRYKLVEPRFDDPAARMPNHGLTGEQAAGIVAELLRGFPDTDSIGFTDRVRLLVADLVPHPRQRHLLIFLLVGCAVGGIGACTVLAVRKRLKADRPQRL